MLDVATGTGMVARELRAAYGCMVVGLDQSADMLAAAAPDGGIALVRARGESLPFADETFDRVTFTYLLRYVDDPRATLRELARVLRPGGRLASLEFAVPRGPLWKPLWLLYTRLVLPLAGRVVSRRWGEVCSFLGPSIERFERRHPPQAVAGYWRDAGFDDVHVRTMSVGGGVVTWGTKRTAPAEPMRLRPAFYALEGGAPWRDLWTLLHPPYLAWHLSYVLFGAALAPSPDPRIVAGGLAAFALGVGVAAHAFDELAGRPLRTRLPRGLLAALGAAGLAGAVLLGVLASTVVGPAFLAVVALGAALVLLYAFDAPVVHSDAGFALAWGAFPVVATAIACGAAASATVLAAAGAALLSLAQRRLSSRARRVRRDALAFGGSVTFRDGTREEIDAASLIGAPEGALRVLWLASVALALGALLARWV